MQDSWVLSLGWEDLLEKGMATHFSILAWRIPWTEEFCSLAEEFCSLAGYSLWVHKKLDTAKQLTYTLKHWIPFH